MNTIKRGLGGYQAEYETITMDLPKYDTLYAGSDLAVASQRAMEYGGAAQILHYRHDGRVETVQEYDKGRATRGFTSN